MRARGSQGAPNTALQRTPAASPPSPRSFETFGVMKRHIGRKAGTAGAALILLVSIAMGGPLKPQGRYRVFFPPLTLNSAEGERVDRVEISMTCGSFRSISSIPEDWSVRVVSRSAGVTRFEADAGHGSTALRNLRQLQGSVTISVDSVGCFELSARINAGMQESARMIELPLQKLVLRP
jgi:hypothetical protein